MHISILLRRVKTDVDLKIPPKKEVLVYCPMTTKQRELYEATVNQTLQQLFQVLVLCSGPEVTGMLTISFRHRLMPTYFLYEMKIFLSNAIIQKK